MLTNPLNLGLYIFDRAMKGSKLSYVMHDSGLQLYDLKYHASLLLNQHNYLSFESYRGVNKNRSRRKVKSVGGSWADVEDDEILMEEWGQLEWDVGLSDRSMESR